MIPIHIQANYLPNHRIFKVVVKAGNKKRCSERMTISKFMRMAKDSTKPIKVGGMEIVLHGPGAASAEGHVRYYLKLVAETYLGYTVTLN
jgi:hypothetical protein